jgi:cysteine-rich repeat protein
MRPTSWLVALLLTLALGRVSEAAIDMTGDWYTVIDGGNAILFHFVQTGTSLQAFGGSGTINSATGAFTSMIGFIGPDFCGAFFQAQVSMDGRTFTGTVDIVYTDPNCIGGIFTCGCKATRSDPLYGSRSPCGNGIVDPGEACDDGNLGRNGDCCALGCFAQPTGHACPDDGNLCTADVCSGAGTCAHPPLASAMGCMEPVARRTPGSSLTLKASRPPTRLAWNWRHGIPTTASDFGDPTSATGYALCLYDYSPAGAFLGTAMPIPAGGMCGQRPCWRATGRGFKYVNTAATPAGAQRLVLALIDGTPRITLTGLGPDLTLPTLPLQKEPKVVVQLRNTAGVCWEADYSTAIKNTVTEFKAKSD